MSFTSYVIFWPKTGNRSFLFHFVRCFFLLLLALILLDIYPSMFSLYIFILSLIEYTRRCSRRALFLLYIIINSSMYLCEKVFFSDFRNRSFSNDLLRSTYFFTGLVLDRITCKRFSLASYVALFSFPVILTAYSEILSIIDNFGYAAHMSSFCTDFPDLTFIILKFLGPGGVCFFVSFLAGYTSNWRITRVSVKMLSILLFQILPFCIIVIYVIKFYQNKEVHKIKVALMFNNDSKTINYDDINHYSSKSNLIVFGYTLSINHNKINEMMKNITVPIIIYNNEYNNGYFIYVLKRGNITKHQVIRQQKTIFPILSSFIDMPTLDINGARIGVLADRESYYSRNFASVDVDMMITLCSPKYDEKLRVPVRTSRLITQTTGAARLHVSRYSDTFYMNNEGYFQLIDTYVNESRVYQLLYTKNMLKFVSFRTVFLHWLAFIPLLIVILLDFLPMSTIFSFRSLCEDISELVQKKLSSFSIYRKYLQCA